MEAVPLRSARPLSVLLGRERQILERMCWQLRVAQVLVESDRVGWVGPCLRETDLLADRLGALEFSRALEVAGHPEALDPADEQVEPTLDELVARWPVPGRPVLRRHAVGLRRLVQEVRARSKAVTDGLSQAPPGEPPFDALVRHGGLVVARRVPPPSLVEFVLGDPVRH